MQEKRKVVRRKGELEAADLAAELVAMDSVEARAKVGAMLARKVLGLPDNMADEDALAYVIQKGLWNCKKRS